MDYKKLLDEAYKKVKKVEASGRFEIPEVKSRREGNKTIIENFKTIASHLRRKPEHIEKYLEKSLAAKGKIQGKRLILIKKLPGSRIQEKIKDYVENFVLCKECKKPDTELKKKNGYVEIHCLACGAKHTMAKI